MSDEILTQYYQMIKNKIIQAGFHSAIANINKLLANFPDDSRAYYYMGVCNFALERYEEAMVSYMKAISLDIVAVSLSRVSKANERPVRAALVFSVMK